MVKQTKCSRLLKALCYAGYQVLLFVTLFLLIQTLPINILTTSASSTNTNTEDMHGLFYLTAVTLLYDFSALFYYWFNEGNPFLIYFF